LKGLKAVIVGGTSGIGLEIARQLDQQGCKVIITGRDELKLKKKVQELGDGVLGMCGDIAQEKDRARLTEQVRFNCDGTLDFLVVSAARYETKPLLDETDESVLEMFQTNVISGVFFARQFHELLKAGKGKSILFLSSTLSTKPVFGTSAYSASKAALDSFVSSMALEWAPDHIRVNSIQPGVVDTPIHDQRLENEPTRQEKMVQFADFHPLGRVGEVTDVARAALFLLDPNSSWITGIKMPIDGGISLV